MDKSEVAKLLKGEDVQKPEGERPPKEWMDNCMSRAESFSDDAGAFCGGLWFHPEKFKNGEEMRESFGKDNNKIAEGVIKSSVSSLLKGEEIEKLIKDDNISINKAYKFVTKDVIEGEVMTDGKDVNKQNNYEEVPEVPVKPEAELPPKEEDKQENGGDVSAQIVSLLQEISGKLDAFGKDMTKALENKPAEEMAVAGDGGKVKLPKFVDDEPTTSYGEDKGKVPVKDEGEANFTEKQMGEIDTRMNEVLKQYNIKKSGPTPRPNAVNPNTEVKNEGLGKNEISGTNVLKAMRSGKPFAEVSRKVKEATSRDPLEMPEGVF